jgi:hypothetical protein
MRARSLLNAVSKEVMEWMREHAATRVVCAACPSQRRCAFTSCDSRRGERRWMSAGARGASGSSIWAAVKRAAGNLETWVKSQAVAGSKKIFLFNLSKQLDKVDEARGLAQLYVQRVREECERLEGVAAAHRTDDRSIYHIQTACLVLASYRVLTEQLRMDHISSLNCIRRCLGDSDSAGTHTHIHTYSLTHARTHTHTHTHTLTLAQRERETHTHTHVCVCASIYHDLEWTS